MNYRKAGCIGTGVMGTALMRSVLTSAGSDELAVYDTDSLKAKDFASETGCFLASSAAEVTSMCHFVFLAVKPVILPRLLEEITPSLKPDTVLVSMAAGVTIETISRHCGGHSQIIRIMPNTPVSVGSGVIAIAPSAHVGDEDIQALVSLLGPSGLCEKTAETLMDAVTAVSGSGPAYGYIFIDALADAAVRMGMGREQALRYAAQTLKGAASMVLETGTHPAVLKDGVCSPAGTTIAAVTALEAAGFRNAVITAALSAWERAREIGRQG